MTATTEKHEAFQYNDGGRSDAGFKGDTRDCVCRAISIASGRPYMEVYERLAEGNATQRRGKYESSYKAGKRTASRGINTKRKWFKDYMSELGFTWTPTMGIGTGCKVHLVADELPSGRLVVAVSKHYTAMIDGVIHDTHNPQREIHWTNTTYVDGERVVTHSIQRRCVYGYWKFQGGEA